MAFLFVKPVPGRTPRHESTHRQLQEEGEYWADTPYTRRRLRDGDIVEATDPATLPNVSGERAVEKQTNEGAENIAVGATRTSRKRGAH